LGPWWLEVRPVLTRYGDFWVITVAANRHWRTWLHAKSQFGELIPFAQWLKNAFGIGARGSKDESRQPLVTVVDRKGTRAVLNMDELVAALQVAMPNATIQRQAFELLSFSEQLRVRATVRDFLDG
jgi:hypothetical protein